MPSLKLTPLAALTACLAACGTDEPPEPVEIVPATVPEPVMTEATHRVALQDMIGGELGGQLTVTPMPDSVTFHLELTGAAPETTYGVRIQPGTCQSPGAEVAVLEAIRTGALGNGSSHRSLREDWQPLLAGGHVVAIYAPTAVAGTDRPLACAAIPPVQPGPPGAQPPTGPNPESSPDTASVTPES